MAVFALGRITPQWRSLRAEPVEVAVFEAKLDAMLQDGVAGPDLPALIALARTRQDGTGFAGLRPRLTA